jgi:hypothetical protein
MVQGQPYDQNGHVEVTYKTFCKEPYRNQFLCHWNMLESNKKIVIQEFSILRGHWLTEWKKGLLEEKAQWARKQWEDFSPWGKRLGKEEQEQEEIAFMGMTMKANRVHAAKWTPQ